MEGRGGGRGGGGDEGWLVHLNRFGMYLKKKIIIISNKVRRTYPPKKNMSPLSLMKSLPYDIYNKPISKAVLSHL